MSFHYLIDGYNLLYALPQIPSGPLEIKRNALLRKLTDHKPQGKNRLTVVFDSREGMGDQDRWGDLKIIYTAAETADDWISRRVREGPNPRIYIVVSDDQGLRRLLRGTGAKWINTKDFWRQANDPPANRARQGHEIDSHSITEELKKKWL